MTTVFELTWRGQPTSVQCSDGRCVHCISQVNICFYAAREVAAEYAEPSSNRFLNL
jgi:hypothetical protein